MNDVQFLHRQREPATDRVTEVPSKAMPDARPGRRRRWGGWLLGLGVLVVLAGGLSLGAWRQYSQQREAVATSELHRDFVPSVRVAAVRASDGIVRASLPATTSAFAAANIFARASGYVEKRQVDIGDHVKEGQLLALIVAPELDHQIAQAETTLVQLQAAQQQAQANVDLAQVTWNRDSPLVSQGWMTQQKGTVDVETLKAPQAALGGAQPN